MKTIDKINKLGEELSAVSFCFLMIDSYMQKKATQCFTVFIRCLTVLMCAIFSFHHTVEHFFYTVKHSDHFF